jgi:hypothetical protein
MKSFKVKCLTQELSTIDQMKIRRPDLYNNSNWHCILCSEEETFNHLWSCSHRKHLLDTIIKDTVTDIVMCCSSALANSPNKLKLVNELIIAELSCWHTETSDLLSFADIVRGIVPFALIEILVSWGLSIKQSRDILVQVFNRLQGKLRLLWHQRCDAIVAKEKQLNITKSIKKKKRSRFIVNVNNLVFPLFNYSSLDGTGTTCRIIDNS